MFVSASNLFLIFGISGISYVFLLTIYRLTLHPLAKYPGPFLAKVTPWYDAYHGYLKDRHLDQYKCQLRYGNVFRYGPNSLVIQTSGGLRDIYTNAKKNAVRKADCHEFLHINGIASIVFTTDKSVHAFKRRVLSQAFSEQSIRSLETFIINNVDRWLLELEGGGVEERKGWSSSKNMAKYATYLTMDVVGDICFGKRFGAIESESARGLADVTSSRLAQWYQFGTAPSWRIYKYLSQSTSVEKYANPPLYKRTQQFFGYVMNAFKSRREIQASVEKGDSEPRWDFYHYLLQARDPNTGNGYAPFELLAELRTLAVAGSDTSSTVIAAMLFYLTQNPEAMLKVQKELRTTFSDVNDIVTGPQLSSCQYLYAVIEETLRLAAPIQSSLRRQTTADTIIDGMAIPAGTEIGTAIYGIHMSEDFFANPRMFKPERWLSEYTSKDEIDLARSGFCAFSLGNRGCIGKTLAYHELSIALGRLLWTFDVQLKAGDTTGRDANGNYDLKDIYVAENDGPVCQFRRHVVV